MLSCHFDGDHDPTIIGKCINLIELHIKGNFISSYRLRIGLHTHVVKSVTPC